MSPGDLRICICTGGPLDGKHVALEPHESVWRSAGFLLDTPNAGDESPVHPPAGGVYRLDDTGTVLRWMGQKG